MLRQFQSNTSKKSKGNWDSEISQRQSNGVSWAIFELPSEVPCQSWKTQGAENTTPPANVATFNHAIFPCLYYQNVKDTFFVEGFSQTCWLSYSYPTPCPTTQTSAFVCWGALLRPSKTTTWGLKDLHFHISNTNNTKGKAIIIIIYTPSCHYHCKTTQHKNHWITFTTIFFQEHGHC